MCGVCGRAHARDTLNIFSLILRFHSKFVLFYIRIVWQTFSAQLTNDKRNTNRRNGHKCRMMMYQQITEEVHEKDTETRIIAAKNVGFALKSQVLNNPNIRNARMAQPLSFSLSMCLSVCF